MRPALLFNRHLAALLAISGLLFLSYLGNMDIWDIDEGMHAAMAKNIITSGDWITPRINGEPFLDKPILFNWLTAISFLIFGLTEAAARLPAALAGIGCVVLTWDLARNLYGDRVGFIAGLVLATSLEFVILARLVQYDMPFSLCVTLALYAFAKSVVNPVNRAMPAHQDRYFLLFAVATALAVLTKGPLGLLLPLMIIGAFLLVSGVRPHLSRAAILGGIGIFIALTAPWFILMESANDGYLSYFIVTQHFGNVVGGTGVLSARHPEPFYYYLPVLFLGLFPWSVALPQALVASVRSWRKSADQPTLFFLLWFVLTLLLFSASASKLSTYLLPMFPAAAVILSRYLSRFLQEPSAGMRRGLLIGAAALLCPAFLVIAYVLPASAQTDMQATSGMAWSKIEIVVALLTLGWLTFAAMLLRTSNRLALATMSTISPVLVFFLLFVMVPDAEPYKGTRELGVRITQLIPADQRIPMYGQFLDSTLFYTDREALLLHTEDELLDYFATPETRYVLLRYRDDGQAKSIEDRFYLVEKKGNKAIISNQPYF